MNNETAVSADGNESWFLGVFFCFLDFVGLVSQSRSLIASEVLVAAAASAESAGKDRPLKRGETRAQCRCDTMPAATGPPHLRHGPHTPQKTSSHPRAAVSRRSAAAGGSKVVLGGQLLFWHACELSLVASSMGL